EKRALSAAEAAISNPLIDDASMKGAKGLLISITGGKDLTLYEVDEAATRIREEVDQDANIIVGATFDEGLEGVIRVSVVATGIDHVGLQRPATAPEARIAELTQKLRADQMRVEQHQRVAAERIDVRMSSPAAAPGRAGGRAFLAAAAAPKHAGTGHAARPRADDAAWSRTGHAAHSRAGVRVCEASAAPTCARSLGSAGTYPHLRGGGPTRDP